MELIKSRSLSLLFLVFVVSFGAFAGEVESAGELVLPFGALKLHYYKINDTCTYAEEFVKHQVWLAWKKDPSITAALLRLLYSDCFITGCDASILLEGENSEKNAPQNAGLRGFDVIDRIKKVLEIRCPRVVSCSDILNLATKEAVALAGAPKYPVFTGRRDGMSTNASMVDLPGPDLTWDDALMYFQSRGLDALDLGTLIGGAHSLGNAHCSSIYNRLYNYNNTLNTRDPIMKPSFYNNLQAQCPKNALANATVYLNPDSGSSYNFTNSLYKRIMRKEAVLGIDQNFYYHRDGRRVSDEFGADFEELRKAFALAISRMGSIAILTGNEGEIRRNCRYTNANNPDGFGA